MYAIIRTGGKQYRVEEGRTVTVERLPAEEGAAVELDNVLLIEDDGKVTVGSPTIDGARVLTEVEAHGRHKKIIVFKYRAKVRTRKKTGHRQHFTRLAVTEILRPGQESKIAKPKRATRRPKAATPVGKTATKPAEEAAAETPVEAAAEATAPKTGTRRKPAVTKTGAAAEATAPKRSTRRKPAAAKAKAETPTAKTAAPKRKTARKKKDDDAADSPKTTASAKSTTAGNAEKKPARRRKATPPKAKPPEAAPASDDTKE